jgi:hypothetical protein
MVNAVEWGTDLEVIAVWYYDADMAADENLTEEEMDLGRTEGLDLAPLECPSAAEVQRWIKEARSACCSRKGGGGVEGRGSCT